LKRRSQAEDARDSRGDDVNASRQRRRTGDDARSLRTSESKRAESNGCICCRLPRGSGSISPVRLLSEVQDLTPPPPRRGLIGKSDLLVTWCRVPVAKKSRVARENWQNCRGLTASRGVQPASRRGSRARYALPFFIHRGWRSPAMTT